MLGQMPVPIVRRRFVRGEDVLREILGPLLAGFLVCVEFEPGVGVLLAAAADQVVGAVEIGFGSKRKVGGERRSVRKR